MTITKINADIYRLGDDKLTTLLHQSGYDTIFDISCAGLSDFTKKNPKIPAMDCQEIYQLAVERQENLHLLFKAWQLHRDPVVQGISKLSSNTGLEGIQSALGRSLGEGADFDDLIPERSLEGYAEATSIQSLFSPGRYLTILYKIAKPLLHTDNLLHIKNRRPDLPGLRLTTDNMNKEVSSLDVLTDVLQAGNPDLLTTLKDLYYPMNLPYDDHLTQVNAVCESYSTNLTKIWETLLDKQRDCFFQSSSSALQEKRALTSKFKQLSRNTTAPLPSARELLSLTPNIFQLMINHHLTVSDLASHYHVTVSQSRPNKNLATTLNDVDDFCEKTDLSFNDLLSLTAQNDYTTASSEYKSRFKKFGEDEFVPVTAYGAVFLTELETPLWIKQYENTGILTKRRAPEDDAFVRDGMYANSNFGLETDLVVKTDGNSHHRDAYLKFDLSDFSYPVTSAKISLTVTGVGRSGMTHVARLVDDNNWSEKSITWNNRPSGGEIFATWDVPPVEEFIEIEMTKQVNDALARGRRFISLVISASQNFGSTGDVIFASKDHANQFITPYIDLRTGPTLNFTDNNVVELAGRAEKLVRLSQKTGLSFEELDWLIVNANIGARNT